MTFTQILAIILADFNKPFINEYILKQAMIFPIKVNP